MERISKVGLSVFSVDLQHQFSGGFARSVYLDLTMTS